MKLAFVHISGFRGFPRPVRIDFSDTFTVIDGRNGVGKSTIFDAVEFALTGTISKYLDAKADRESVEDYLWWAGEGDAVSERFVEVGFSDGEIVSAIRRTPLDPKEKDVRAVTEKLFEPEFAPKHAISQLCSSTIIRDEHIARLSLDLKEADRFILLRDAIGAVDAEDWIKRAQGLTSAVSARLKSATADVDLAKAGLATAIRHIDQVRATVPESSVLREATSRLQNVLGTTASSDQLPDVVRRRLAEIASEYDKVAPLVQRCENAIGLRNALPQLQAQVEETRVAAVVANLAYEERVAALSDMPVSTGLERQARQLEALANMGRTLGLHDGHCPLCMSGVSHEQFEEGIKAALDLARRFDSQAVDQAEKERARDAAQAVHVDAEAAYGAAMKRAEDAEKTLAELDRALDAVSLKGATLEDVQRRVARLDAERQTLSADLQLVSTMSFDRVLVRATRDQQSANDRVRRAEERLGRARLAETRAKAVYDAARRAAAETLDQRLDRVLPLMSELYKRLRPHPVWDDIEYSVRGDVQRFLKLQVGADINPQFVFSSGQRRATGLAFLLSVNLSIAWSRWHSILLDDPVQHVDDFRTVHLAEVLAHLCQSGRQIVCAVEDSALADLMCRRLPTTASAPGKRITLGTDAGGAPAVIHDANIAPLNRRALVVPDLSLRASGLG